jgi:hypothetical protein
VSITWTWAPASRQAATAVSPSIPAPPISTRRPDSCPAASSVAITVAVAQAAGAATASGIRAGTTLTVVPRGSTMCSA